MNLYHGSNMEVAKSRIIRANRFLDFGFGFCTTTDIGQAESFAQKVVARERGGAATVSVYEFDPVIAAGECSTLSFPKADPEWLDFVLANRTGEYDGPMYDIVSGPVANDNVYLLCRSWNRGTSRMMRP